MLTFEASSVIVFLVLYFKLSNYNTFLLIFTRFFTPINLYYNLDYKSKNKKCLKFFEKIALWSSKIRICEISQENLIITTQIYNSLLSNLDEHGQRMEIWLLK